MRHLCRFHIVLLILLVSGSVGYSQGRVDLPQELADARGVYQTETERPLPFESFKYFYIDKLHEDDDAGIADEVSGDRIAVSGKLVLTDGRVFAFSKAHLGIVTIGDEKYYRDIEFETEAKGGVKYCFKGAYVEHIIRNTGAAPRIKIRGTLSLVEKGSVKAIWQLALYEYGEE